MLPTLMLPTLMLPTLMLATRSQLQRSLRRRRRCYDRTACHAMRSRRLHGSACPSPKQANLMCRKTSQKCGTVPLAGRSSCSSGANLEELRPGMWEVACARQDVFLRRVEFISVTTKTKTLEVEGGLLLEGRHEDRAELHPAS